MTEQILDLPDEIRTATLSKKLRWIAQKAIQKAAGNPVSDSPGDADVVLYRTGTRARPYSDVSTAANALSRANQGLAPRLGGRFVGTSEVDPPGGRDGWLIVGFVPDPPEVPTAEMDG